MAEWEHMDGVSRGNFTVHSKWEAQPGSKPGVTLLVCSPGNNSQWTEKEPPLHSETSSMINLFLRQRQAFCQPWGLNKLLISFVLQTASDSVLPQHCVPNFVVKRKPFCNPNRSVVCFFHQLIKFVIFSCFYRDISPTAEHPVQKEWTVCPGSVSLRKKDWKQEETASCIKQRLCLAATPNLQTSKHLHTCMLLGSRLLQVSGRHRLACPWHMQLPITLISLRA